MSTTIIFFIILVFLICLSGFFSGSETGMMAVNRYRVRHAAKSNKHANLVQRLLELPERLLATILIGNTFANILASSIATMLAVRWYGEIGGLIASVILTFIILIFAEVIPKTVAALYPERIAFTASGALNVVAILLSPLVWLVNKIAKGFLRIFGLKLKKTANLHLTSEELRTLVNEAGNLLPQKNKAMLLRILDLKHITVDDVMVPRQEITGIDLTDDWSTIESAIKNSQYSKIPLFDENINNVKGVLYLHDIIQLNSKTPLTLNKIKQKAHEPYFIPAFTPLATQLLKFQENKKKMGFIVDEYGDIQGLVTLNDILEEIVGEFNNDIFDTCKDIHPQRDNSYLVDGSANIRELNRRLGWKLPTHGAKTLSGAITEYLESIPEPNTCIKLDNYPIEIMQVKDKMVKKAKIFPPVVI